MDRLHDIYDIWYEPFWHKTWFMVSVGAAGTCLFVLLCWLLYRLFGARYQRRTRAHEQALHDLQQLHTMIENQEVTPTQVYTQLTKILKTYLTQRFELPMTSDTDDELRRRVRNITQLAPWLQQLDPLLMGAVRIKFSREPVMPQTMSDDLAVARHIVTATSGEEKTN